MENHGIRDYGKIGEDLLKLSKIQEKIMLPNILLEIWSLNSIEVQEEK